MAAVKNEEFVNIINTCLDCHYFLLDKTKKVEGFLDTIIDLRSLHTKMERELEEMLSSPHYDLYEEQGLVKGKKYLHDLYVDIRNTCKDIGVSVVFTREGTMEFKKRIFAYYTISGQDINGLIFYNRKTKVYSEDINDLDLD